MIDNSQSSTLDDGDFVRNIRKYRERIDSISGERRGVIFWSFLSILYFSWDLQLNIATTSAGKEGIATPWGIPIVGMTEDKFILFILFIISYYRIELTFKLLKINKELGIFGMFNYVLHLDDFTIGHLGAYPVSNEQDDELGNETRLFMYRHRIYGFLEYFFAPIVFPIVLYVWAIFLLIGEACF